MEVEEDAVSTSSASSGSHPENGTTETENGDVIDTNNEVTTNEIVMSGAVTDTTEINKAVTWPPSQTASGFSAAAASRYLKLVERTTDSSHSQYTLSRELFKPGKLDEERWKESCGEGTDKSVNHPTELDRCSKRGFRKLDDFLHTDEKGPAKMPSYHVPPGTTRTRKAQENYQKHLETP